MLLDFALISYAFGLRVQHRQVLPIKENISKMSDRVGSSLHQLIMAFEKAIPGTLCPVILDRQGSLYLVTEVCENFLSSL